MTKGKTITTYLIDGNPNGIRTCFISNKICKAVVVPRAKLMDAKKRSELHQPALYILISDSDDKIYIGETDGFLSRVRDHEAKKSFWDQAIMFVSKDNDLTKSDVKYLEYLAIKDLTFKRPSAASSFCRGNSSNGWVDWVNDNGQTLDEVYRNLQNRVI